MGIVWNLAAGPCTFRALQERCESVSPTVLNKRLRELRDAGLIATSAGDGYRLSPAGKRLYELLEPLGAWSKRWARSIPGDES
jgi:DNA-binding HxlR family transcriptional regulator